MTLRPARWLLLGAVLGAASWLYLVWSAGRAELRALCARDSLPRVYRQASAEGYFDGGVGCSNISCVLDLVHSPFRYIEYRNTLPRPGQIAGEPGVYRLRKQRRESGPCDPQIDREYRDKHAFRAYFAEGCVSLERLEHPEARYGVFAESLPTVRVQNLFDSVITVRRYYISEVQTGELVAEQVRYRLSQRSLPVFSSFGTVLHCATRGIAEETRPPSVTSVKAYVKPV